jgi:uncharacterized protein
MIRGFLLVLALLVAAPAAAQTYPALSGRVVDQAELLSPAQEAELSTRLEALERASSRQLVVATVSSLEDVPIEDYGYQLGRHWRIGQGNINNGVILLVAPNERRVRIEVGYGLEPVITDALSSQIVDRQILPRFRQNDYAGGIIAGADALIQQLGAPPEAAEQRAVAAARTAQNDRGQRSRRGGGFPFSLIFWILILLFVIIPLIRSGHSGRSYRRRRRGWGGPIILWGPGWGGGSGGWGGPWGGGSSGGSWGGGGGGSSWGGGGGGGGFSGGGGSFGGGGASGGW